ncbi:MAG: hypothetical protein Fur0032_19810 [Terrimicrobiaceae bacterium]
MQSWLTGWLAALIFLGPILSAWSQDASLLTGRPLAPMELRWRPEIASNPLPGWAVGPVDATAGSAIFPIPAIWQQGGIDRYLLTVVFEDTTDSGPIVEWRSRDGRVTRLSEGLGEDKNALGLHARSLLIPSELSKQGGAVVVSMPWRPDGLVRAAVEPARDVTVAVLGSAIQPGAIDRAGMVREMSELDGLQPAAITGDVRSGPIVEAELSGGIEPLGTELEFEVPVDGIVEGGVLNTEILGIDPASRVFVWLNGVFQGELNSEAFRLDDAAVAIGTGGRLTFAGWRSHNLFLQGSAWQMGINHLLLRLRRGEGDSGRPVSLKNTHLHLRFSPEQQLSSFTTDILPPMVSIEHVTPAPADSTDGLPDFGLVDGIIEEPPPLPAVVTAPPHPKTPAPTVITSPPSVSVSPPQPEQPGRELLEGNLPVEQ